MDREGCARRQPALVLLVCGGCSIPHKVVPAAAVKCQKSIGLSPDDGVDWLCVCVLLLLLRVRRYCGSVKELTLDHITPVCRCGGMGCYNLVQPRAKQPWPVCLLAEVVL